MELTKETILWVLIDFGFIFCRKRSGIIKLQKASNVSFCINSTRFRLYSLRFKIEIAVFRLNSIFLNVLIEIMNFSNEMICFSFMQQSNEIGSIRFSIKEEPYALEFPPESPYALFHKYGR